MSVLTDTNVLLRFAVTRLLTFNTKDFTRYAALVPDVQITDPTTV